jgi:hypothetical protein
VTFLTTKALDLTDGHTLNAQIIEGVFNLVEFKGFNNGFNFIDHALLLLTVRADPD